MKYIGCIAVILVCTACGNVKFEGMNREQIVYPSADRGPYYLSDISSGGGITESSDVDADIIVETRIGGILHQSQVQLAAVQTQIGFWNILANLE